MNSSSHAIHVADLSVQTGRNHAAKALLSDISFTVAQGSFVGIIGASGCGKTTLLRALIGTLDPASGRVLVAGYPVRDLRAQLPLALAYLPQFGPLHFHPTLTVEETLRDAAA